MLEITNLTKYYDKTPVLKNFTHSFVPGAVTAVTGPNGSGKTTLIKCITGLLKFSNGEIRVAGENIKNTFAYRRHIGYMSQKASFPENLTVSEIISMVKSLSTAAEFDTILVEMLGFRSEYGKKFGALSGGNKQKLNAILTFLHTPDIILLDEPTAGLDKSSGDILREKITEEKEKGKTIILTTHIPEEITMLTDYVLMLEEGRKKSYMRKDEYINSMRGSAQSGSDFINLREESSDVCVIKSIAV